MILKGIIAFGYIKTKHLARNFVEVFCGRLNLQMGGGRTPDMSA
jgi:hypothetical protein